MGNIPIGLCRCGCGQQTRISDRDSKKYGWNKGKPRPFVKGHNTKGVPRTPNIRMKISSGLKEYNQLMGRHKHIKQYKKLLMPDHHRADINGYVKEHILIVEAALGKPIPIGVSIHHFPKYPCDQLVICENDSYHQLLHRRHRAYLACGHASWRKCWICKRYNDIKNLMRSGRKEQSYVHSACLNKYSRMIRATKKAHAT